MLYSSVYLVVVVVVVVIVAVVVVVGVVVKINAFKNKSRKSFVCQTDAR